MRRPAGVAVLLIDVINAFEFPNSGPLVRAAERAAPKIDNLAQAARRIRVPVIYVNDNFGRWSVAANTPALTKTALNHVRTVLGGGTPSAKNIRFSQFRGRRRKPRGQTF